MKTFTNVNPSSNAMMIRAIASLAENALSASATTAVVGAGVAEGDAAGKGVEVGLGVGVADALGIVGEALGAGVDGAALAAGTLSRSFDGELAGVPAAAIAGEGEATGVAAVFGGRVCAGTGVGLAAAISGDLPGVADGEADATGEADGAGLAGEAIAISIGGVVEAAGEAAAATDIAGEAEGSMSADGVAAASAAAFASVSQPTRKKDCAKYLRAWPDTPSSRN